VPKRDTSPRSVDSVYKDAHAQETSGIEGCSWREVYAEQNCNPDAHEAGW